jgi:Domain of unknown function (DUF4397)
LTRNPPYSLLGGVKTMFKSRDLPPRKGVKVKFRSLVAAAAAVIASAGFILPLSPASAQAGQAKLRFAHFAPDAPAVDVYFDGTKKLTNLAYEKHSQYLALAAGTHKIEVRATGSAANVPAVITFDGDLGADTSYTLAAIGKLASLKSQLYTDDTSTPEAGKVKLRVIHNAPEIAAVDVVVKNGASLSEKLSFPNASPYITLTPGKYDVEVRAAGDTKALLASTVVLQPGGVYTIAAIGGADKKPKLKGLIDLQATGVAGSATTVGGAEVAVTTAVSATPSSAPASAPDSAAATTAAAPTTVAAVETTAAPETTVAVETTLAEATTDQTVPGSIGDAVESTLPPETTPAVEEEEEAKPATEDTVPATPAGGVESGGGGLAGGGAVGATALAAAAAIALTVASQRRRSVR